MSTKTVLGSAAFAILFLTFLAPAVNAQGLPTLAVVEPPVPDVGDLCRWWEESLALVEDAYGGLFLPIEVDGTSALVQVAPAGPADAAGPEESCTGGELRACAGPSADEGLAVLIGWVGCYRLADGPDLPDLQDRAAAECPLDKLLSKDSAAAEIPCLDGFEVPDPCGATSQVVLDPSTAAAADCLPENPCQPAAECIPDPCGATLALVLDPSRAAGTDCLPCQPAAECVPESPCQPAAECIPDPCGSTLGLFLDPSTAAGTDCLPCQPYTECVPANPCQPTSECVPPTCPTLRVVPGQCGSEPLSTDICDYIGPSMPTANVDLPCDGSIDECQALRFVPGQCGTPPLNPCPTLAVVPGQCGSPGPTDCSRIPSAVPVLCGHPTPDPCDYIGPSMPTANVDLPCDGSIDECDYLRLVPGQCETPPFDPCEPLVTLNADAPGGGSGFVINGPCGPIPVPGPCDLAPDTPFVCIPGPDPCVRPKGGECYTTKGLVYTIAKLIDGHGLDEDLDRMGDEWERRVVGTLDYLVDWALDLDHDGLQNLDEFRWDTHPLDPDTDDDGLQDGPEAAYWDRTPDQAVSLDSGVALRDTDSKTDTDGDGTPNILDPDSDDDHLLDGQEYYGTYSAGVRTFLEFPDSDLQGAGDGLTDYQEVLDRDDNPGNGVDGSGYGTLPMDEDSDDDVVLDGDEAARWGAQWDDEFDCSPGSNNLRDADADGDTLTDGAEWDQHLSDPRNVDSDGDVMDDGYEVLKGFVPSNGADGSNDVDSDGLGSAFEYAFERPSGYQVCAYGPFLRGFDPHVADMDGDALTDGAEIDGRHNPYSSPSNYAAYPRSTDVKSSDSDYDGLSDFQEMLGLGTNPNDSDTDGDGLADGNEAAFGTSPTDPDSDNDGLNDGGEQRAGTNPNLGDSDGDGAQDGSDSNPRQENIPPSYPGGPSAYVVFREDGYIDVVIEEPNSEEANVAGVQLSGSLTATGPSGSLPSLSFNMEATRGDDGIWGARVGIPPGVSQVTHESIRLLVVDDNGIGWATTGSFGNTLAGPAWASSPDAVKTAHDWQTLIEHQSPAATDGGSGASLGTPQLRPGPDGTTLYDPEGSLGAVSIYRVDPLAFTPMQLVDTPFGAQGVAIAEDGFVWVDPAVEPDLYEDMAFGFKWKAPKYLYSGIQTRTREFLNSAYKTTESALRETQYQAASFILGSDHPAAHGRSAGDFVGGFLLWGDFRDCIIRPTYINPQTDAAKIIDAAITALSCTGLAVDLAQATPGAPAAVAANAAMTLIKLALKKLVRVAAELGVHLVDMIEICAKNLTLCPAVGGLAKLAKDDDLSRDGAKRLMDALGPEDVVKLEKSADGITKKAAAMQNDFPGWTDAQHKALATRMHQSTPLSSNPDVSFQKLVELHGKFPAGGINAKSNIVPSALDFMGRPGGLKAVTDTLDGKVVANDNRVFAFMAWSKMTKDGRVLDQVEVPATAVTLKDGTGAVAKPDAYVTWPNGRGQIVTEIKDAPLTASTKQLDQLEREMALAKQNGGTQMDIWSSKYTASLGPNQVDANFKQQAKIHAERYDVTLFVRDGNGAAVWNTSLP